jgi:hypothetical protein
MYAMDKFQISINPKLKNINNPNEDVLTVPISILFSNPILNQEADRVKFMILRWQITQAAAQRNQQNQNETRHKVYNNNYN